MSLYNIIIPHNIKSNDSINGSISFFKPIIKFWKRQSYIWTLIYNVSQPQILQLSTRIQEMVLQGTDIYVTMYLSSRGDTILIYRKLRLALEKLVIWILIYTTWYQTLLNISVGPQSIHFKEWKHFFVHYYGISISANLRILNRGYMWNIVGQLCFSTGHTLPRLWSYSLDSDLNCLWCVRRVWRYKLGK